MYKKMNAGGPRAKAPNKNHAAKKKSISSTHLKNQTLSLLQFQF
jgi:hypothetical protein